MVPQSHPPPQGPLAPQGRLGPSCSAKGKMSPGRLPETALLGHGGIKGGNRLSSAVRLRGGAGDRRGRADTGDRRDDSVIGALGTGRLMVLGT